MVDNGLAATGYEEVGLLSLSSADHSEIADVTKGLADRYEGTNTSLCLPSTRVDAFNIDLANELCRNGRRSGLTFAPEGGSERIRRSSTRRSPRTTSSARSPRRTRAGWRQVKLYFMCGLPTETDEDVLQIADLAKKVIRAGREATGQPRHPLHRLDRRLRAQAAHAVPVGRASSITRPPTRGSAKLRDAIRADRNFAKAIGFRYHDGKPGTVEGLLCRGDRRIGEVIRAAWEDGGRFDGWSEHFSYDRWMAAADRGLAGTGVDVDWYTTREREQAEVLPWDHLDSGLDKEWLWEDWQDALAEVEVDDCRWTPCFDCGVCPQMGTDIQVGPTGRDAAAAADASPSACSPSRCRTP